jgi:hypothetical protein
MTSTDSPLYMGRLSARLAPSMPRDSDNMVLRKSMKIALH